MQTNCKHYCLSAIKYGYRLLNLIEWDNKNKCLQGYSPKFKWAQISIVKSSISETQAFERGRKNKLVANMQWSLTSKYFLGWKCREQVCASGWWSRKQLRCFLGRMFDKHFWFNYVIKMVHSLGDLCTLKVLFSIFFLKISLLCFHRQIINLLPGKSFLLMTLTYLALLQEFI